MTGTLQVRTGRNAYTGEPAWKSQPATDKQRETARKHLPLRDLGEYEGAREAMTEMLDSTGWTKGQASEFIDFLFSQPKRQAADAVDDAGEALSPGMYVAADGTVIKLVLSQAKNLYGKALVEIGGVRLTDLGEVHNFEFQYLPGLQNAAKGGHRMSLDEAKAFGIQYGVCCVCGTDLKDAKSVARGIGPVCAKRL